MNYKEKLNDALNFYGADNQYREFNSEVGELAIELADFLTPDYLKEKSKILSKEDLHENLKSEFADVFIMLGQMMILTGVTEEELKETAEWKILRQEHRIEKKRIELQK